MSLISPKPIIARTHQTWRIPPGMVIALIEDLEHRLWVVETCPAGTQFWTLEQAADLELGTHTRGALQEAVRLGRQVQQAQAIASRRATRQPKAVRKSVRVIHEERPVTRTSRQAKVRSISTPGRKTLVGV
ncbi:MAG TPA: hypothetical protein VKU00_09830 [Chthonomonadaceae bacterium]|nr:hypothetical protein [Chthonomonadaceae bacterium]